MTSSPVAPEAAPAVDNDTPPPPPHPVHHHRASSSLTDSVSLGLPPPSYASLTTPLNPTFSTFPGPSYATQFEHPHTELNLPSGFFLLRSKAGRQRTFDVIGRRTEHGSEIGLHPVKQPHVPRNTASLQNQYNNQVFYLDWNGHLMAASADGRAIDCLDGALSLAIPTPIFAIPSRESHPLPRFSLDPHTSVLHVLFGCDPLFPGPHSTHDWTQDEYAVEAVPVRARRREESAWSTGILSGIERFGAGLFGGRNPLSPLLPPSPETIQRPTMQPPWETTKPPSTRTVFDLPPAPALPPAASTSFLQGGSPLPPLPPSPAFINDEDSDSDDEPEAYRPLRVIRLPPNWREKFPHAALARPSMTAREPKHIRLWRRRQWDVVPVVVRPLEGPGTEQPLVPIPSLPSLSALPSLPSLPALPPLRPLLSGQRGPPPSPLVLNGINSSHLGFGDDVHGMRDRSLPRVPESSTYDLNGPPTGNSLSWADARVLPAGDIAGLVAGSSPSQQDSDEEGDDGDLLTSPDLNIPPQALPVAAELPLPEPPVETVELAVEGGTGADAKGKGKEEVPK